ncbi:MFS transporter [Comamonas sp. JUb58]|uniref:MFS transporter n=1 Tax=Comamonas sp. JUb58 TaxID=2485114 RepID=UPI0010608ACD|nr:MFS transporter [Comamonas sp. JUb58]TDS84598.1 putative MFS family arabinose efflux permease [Comamonas sp. JUb58]
MPLFSAPSFAPGQVLTTCKLGLGQMLSWGSAFYLPAILAGAMGESLGIPPSRIFAAFSLALLMMALTGPVAGRLIDRWGGRPLLMATNLWFALGLVLLSQVQTQGQLFAVWLLLGLAMGAGLYEAAFATSVRLYGKAARGSIVGITLFGGFASTLSWPLTTWLLHSWGWREACLVWAAVQLLVLLPLHASLPRAPARASADAVMPPAGLAAAPTAPTTPLRGQWLSLVLLALTFAAIWFIGTSMMSHLPRLLMVSGATATAAVAAAALVGPAQVASRIADYAFLRRAHPLWSARIAVMAYPLAALALAVFGASGSWAYALAFGLGNGIMTVVIGTLPLAMFGAQGYGQRQGLLMVPARMTQASAPFLFGLALEQWQLGALWVLMLAASIAGTALWCLRAKQV